MPPRFFILDDPEHPIPNTAEAVAEFHSYFHPLQETPMSQTTPIGPPSTTPATTESKDREPLKPFMPRVIDLIIKPEIIAVHNDATANKNPIADDTDLWNRFRLRTGSCVSAAKFKEWLTMGGISFEKQTVIRGIVPHVPEDSSDGLH